MQDDNEGWKGRFDRLLKAMSQGEPHKAEKRQEKSPKEAGQEVEHVPSKRD